MKELFVPHPIAVLAKEKGFNQPCLGWYNGEKLHHMILGNLRNDEWPSHKPDFCVAPLYQQLIDWLRDKYHLHIWTQPMGDIKPDYYTWYMQSTGDIVLDEYSSPKYKNWSMSHASYGEAMEDAIKKAFKLI